MTMDKKMERKVNSFVTGIVNAYRSESEQSENELTEDFMAMLMAMWAVYMTLTDGEGAEDLIGFTHVLNRLAFDQMMEAIEDADSI